MPGAGHAAGELTVEVTGPTRSAIIEHMFDAARAEESGGPPSRPAAATRIAPGVYSLARLRRHCGVDSTFRVDAVDAAEVDGDAPQVDAAVDAAGVGLPDAAALSDVELVEGVVALEREVARLQARQSRLLAEFTRRRPADRAPSTASVSVASPYAADEIGAALTLSRATAVARLAQAARLAGTLSATLRTWETGLLDAVKVRAIVEATACLPDEIAVAVQDRVLPRAPRQTPAQLRAALARAVIAVDPAGADARHRAARLDRRVLVAPAADGMASLWALLSAPAATGAYEWLSRLARALGPEDPRSMDARRADILADLLTGTRHFTADTADTAAVTDTGTGTDAGAGTGADRGVADRSVGGGGRVSRPTSSGRALVQVIVDLDTLTGTHDHPAELTGYGPIPPALAREIAADAVWRRLVTDPDSGALLDHGRRTYHPPAALADHVRARDQHCRFPGCRRRALTADLDHTVAWEHGGPTSATNLHALCSHHHRLKHHAGWDVTARRDGMLVWTSPTGRTYRTAPHDYRPEPCPRRPPPGVSRAGPPTPAPPTPTGVADDRDDPPF